MTRLIISDTLTGPGHLPQAIFADLDTLAAAPRKVIASGAGDVIAKWTSTADWRLGALLWTDRFNEAIAQRFTAALSEKVLSHWDDIQAIAADVPAPEKVIATLRRVGGPTTVAELGLEPRDLADALMVAHYLRNRLPMLRLRRMLQIA